MSYLEDRREAYAWYEQQGFNGYDVYDLDQLVSLESTNEEAERKCDWHSLRAREAAAGGRRSAL